MGTKSREVIRRGRIRERKLGQSAGKAMADQRSRRQQLAGVVDIRSSSRT